jgi:hypothetical protein
MPRDEKLVEGLVISRPTSHEGGRDGRVIGDHSVSSAVPAFSPSPEILPPLTSRAQLLHYHRPAGLCGAATPPEVGGLSAWVACLSISEGPMRDVQDGVDLANLQAARDGFIVNDRPDGRKLHQAGCEAVGAMHANAYRKIFFDSAKEAVDWLNSQYGNAWKPCGHCRGAIEASL